MSLFSNEKSLQEYEKYKKAREEFRDANSEMTDTLDLKTIDSKKIDYAKVHISVYDKVGLGKEWRIEKSQNSLEIESATGGFQTVSKGLEPFPDKSIWSKNLIKLILSFFKKQ